MILAEAEDLHCRGLINSQFCAKIQHDNLKCSSCVCSCLQIDKGIIWQTSELKEGMHVPSNLLTRQLARVMITFADII